jgi:purine nucleoside phosphorylase
MQQVSKHIISEDQNGFSPSRRCVNGLFIVQQVAETRTATGEETHVTFIDLEKTYDLVLRNRLWRTLEKYNIDNRLIKKLYVDIKAYIK